MDQCWHRADKLYRSSEELRHAVHLEDVDGVLEILATRRDCVSFLKQNVQRHHQMPMALGSGHTDVEQKAKAMVLKFHREARDIPALQRISGRVCSFTVDMGTESGIADLGGGTVKSYLPAFMNPAPADEQLQPDVDGLEMFMDVKDQDISENHLFPRALVCPGLDHVSNNMQADLDKHLPNWTEWLPGFTGLSMLLSKRHLLKRLVATCIENTPYSSFKQMFESTLPSTAKWRWGTICKTLPRLLQLYRPLRIVWSASKFQGSDPQVPVNAEGDSNAEASAGGNSETLRIGDITKALQSPFWFAYAHMILAVRDVGNRISAWGSGCACHEWLQPKANAGPGIENSWDIYLAALHREHRLPYDLEGASLSCPLAGKRAPELASGRLKKVLEECIASRRPQVLMKAADLSHELQDVVMRDFQTAVDFIMLCVDVKLGFWQDYPWNLCALVEPGLDDSQRQVKAESLLKDFSELPQDSRAHHRVTSHFLKVGSPLRADLDKLAASHRLCDLPVLQRELSALAFIPVVERVVEGEHSLLHRHAGYRQVTGAYVSCSLRMCEIESLLQSSSGQERMEQAFESVRKPRRIAKLFSFDTHPEWLEQLSRPKQEQHRLGRLSTAIMYSNDVALQFLKLKNIRKLNSQAKRKEMERTVKIQNQFERRGPPSQETILQHFLSQHVASSLQPGKFYSIPVDALQKASNMSSLDSVLALPKDDVSREEQSRADLAPCLQHAPVSLQLPGCQASDHVFFKVLSTSVGNLKTVRRAPAGKRRLHKGDIAVTFHKAENVSDGGHETCLVHAEPLTCSAGGTAIHVLGAVGMDAESVGQVVKWQPGSVGCLTLPNYATQADSALLQRLMAAKAFAGQESGLPDSTSVSGAMRANLQDMEHDGWVVLNSTHGWQLTKKALSSMSVARSVEHPSAFQDLQTSSPALEDQTQYELLKRLRDQGWEWKPLKRGQSTPYTLEGSKTWYSPGCQISKAYVLSLLQAESFLQPGQEIHHGMKAKYYQCLLQGQYESAQALLPAKQHQVQGQAPALEDESAQGPVPLALLPDDDFLWCPPSSVPSGPTEVPVPRDTRSEMQPKRQRLVASRKRKREHLSGQHGDDSDDDVEEIASSASHDTFDSLWNNIGELFDDEGDEEKGSKSSHQNDDEAPGLLPGVGDAASVLGLKDDLPDCNLSPPDPIVSPSPSLEDNEPAPP